MIHLPRFGYSYYTFSTLYGSLPASPSKVKVLVPVKDAQRSEARTAQHSRLQQQQQQQPGHQQGSLALPRISHPECIILPGSASKPPTVTRLGNPSPSFPSLPARLGVGV